MNTAPLSTLDKKSFDALIALGYNRIPLVREIMADLDTPLSAYLKLANQPYSYLFESVQGGEKWGRYSIIGLACRETIKVFGNLVELRKGDADSVEVESTILWPISKTTSNNLKCQN